MNKMRRKLLGVGVLIILSSVTLYVWSHGGGLDSRGGHTNRKTGEYHFHRKPAQRQAPRPTPTRPAPTRSAPASTVQPQRVESFGLPTTAAGPYPTVDLTSQIAHRVVRVIDGDTIEVDRDGTVEKVRLIGVDTPETVHPQKPVEAFGRDASAFTRNLLGGEEVYLRYGDDERDRYGRVLAYVYRAPDGMFVNLEIVRQGYGHAYTEYPFEYMELFRTYERRAREIGKGLWSASAPSAASRLEEPSTQIGTAPTAGQEASGGVTVYITRTGSKYHRSGCRYLSKSRIATSLNEAKARYGPCSVCGPPK